MSSSVGLADVGKEEGDSEKVSDGGGGGGTDAEGDAEEEDKEDRDDDEDVGTSGK